MLIDDLIHLSKIFKDGYTIELKEGKLNQYTNYDKPFIVSYLTIIKITGNNTPTYTHIKLIPNNCIIGGWNNPKENIFYIELNEAFKLLSEAEKFAIKYSQKHIYNIKNGACIKTRKPKTLLKIKE